MGDGINNMKYKYFGNDQMKIIKSDVFNMIFNKETGYTETFGKDRNEEQDFCPFGPIILDVEITDICNGINGKLCSFCYKSNSPVGKNMSFDAFKTIFDKLPNTVTQIAFGVDSEANSNPDIWKIFNHCKENGVIPNLTVANISNETAKNIHKYCGAVAVSRYDDKNVCYDSVKKLTDLGMTQVNIHQMISEETFDNAMETLDDIINDKRLSKLNAIVFLGLKKKGRGTKYNCLSKEKFEILMNKAFENKINVGLDSCSGKRFIDYCEKYNKNKLKQYVTGCESTKQSYYINVEGFGFPCSFTENEYGFENGIDLTKVDDFVKDVWYNEKTIGFRNSLGKNCFSKCPVFKIE